MVNELDKIRKAVPHQISGNAVISGAYQCSFPHLFEMHVPKGATRGEYAITLLIPKNDPMVAPLVELIKKSVIAKFGEAPKKWVNPLRDGDENSDSYPEQAGHWTLKINNKRDQPLVVDRDKMEITDAREIYPGAVVRAKFEVFAYDNVNKGVGCGLKYVQKIADAEPFSGSAPEKIDDIPDLDLPEAPAKQNNNVVSNEDPFADFG